MPVSNSSNHSSKDAAGEIATKQSPLQENQSMNGEVTHAAEEMAHEAPYVHLMQQMKSLKLENSSLTSQVSRLESVASNLQEMVLKLGNSIKYQPAMTYQDNLGQNSIPGPSRISYPSYDEMGMLSSRHTPWSINAGFNCLPPINEIPLHFNPSKIIRQINNLQLQRSAICVSLKQEELSKEKYQTQLNEMEKKLKNLAETDQPCTTTTENNTQHLESRIKEVRLKMEQNLGTPKMMQQRKQDWITQLHQVEYDIYRSQQFLANFQQSTSTPLPEDDPTFARKYLLPDHSESVERHRVFNHGDSSFSHISTQTPTYACSYKNLSQEQVSSTSPAPLRTREGSQLWSRTTQTLESSINVSSPPGSSSTAGSNFHLGSGNFLPDHVSSDNKQKYSNLRQNAAQSHAVNVYPSNVSHNSTPFISYLPKEDVPDLRSRLASLDPEELSQIICSLSTSQKGSLALRQCGCIPLLFQLLHDQSLLSGRLESVFSKKELQKKRDMRSKASQALHNIVAYGNSQDKKEIEIPVLKHLEILRSHCENKLQQIISRDEVVCVDQSNVELCEKTQQTESSEKSLHDLALAGIDKNVVRSIQELTKLSYEKSPQDAISELGGVHCVAELLILDTMAAKRTIKAGSKATSKESKLLRHCVGLILVHLTSRHTPNKILVTKMKGLLDVIFDQLDSEYEEIQQAMTGIIRSISWQATKESRDVLLERGAAQALTKCALRAKQEVTLKIMLGALCNLSGHCQQNCIDICSVKGALVFLLTLLTYQSPSKTLHVVESVYGILCNISSVIAKNEDYRKIFCSYQCFQVLVRHLRSSNLTIVNSVCTILWNLSARRQTEKQILQQLGAIDVLRKLAQSKHAVIVQASSALLRFLLTPCPDQVPLKTDKPSSQEKLNTTKQQKSLPGIFCSKSLGNLQQHSLAHSSGIRDYDNNVRPRSTLPFKSPSNDARIHRAEKSRTIHTCTVAESPYYTSSDFVGTQRTEKAVSAFKPHVKLEKYQPRPNSGFSPVKPWRSNDSMSNVNNSNTVPASLWSSNTKSSSDSKSPVATESRSRVTQMPTDLEEKLRHVNDSMQGDDDGPVDYSLQYTDAVQSGNKLSSRPKISSSVEQRKLYADDETYGVDETPTNFSAIYAEEPIYERVPAADEYMLLQYQSSSAEKQVEISNTVGSLAPQELVKEYHVEDTPICFSIHSSLSDLHFDTNNQHKQANNDSNGNMERMDEVHHGVKPGMPNFANEEDDKFETQPGAITPGLCIGMKADRSSGFLTPRTPYQDTPRLYSPSSCSSLGSYEVGSIHSDITSEPGSRMLSGLISPSDLPDSPGQSMPVSRCRSPSNNQDYNSKEGKKFSMHSNNGSNVALPPANMKKPINKTDASDNIAPLRPNVTAISGAQFLKKAHAMSAGYLATLPQADEMTRYNDEEPAMSVMTGFSCLTIDDEKVGPISNHKSLLLESNNDGKSDNLEQNDNSDAKRNEDTEKKSTNDTSEDGNRAIRQAGYITSLPTNDEIKHFVFEGTLSPMTSLSEISALHTHNDGFQKICKSSSKKKHSIASNRNSYASRSSATGASVPLPAVSQPAEPCGETSSNVLMTLSGANDAATVSQVMQENRTESITNLNEEAATSHTAMDQSSSLSDFSDSSSDDDDENLLQKYINLAIPKKKSTSKSSGSKSGKSPSEEKAQVHKLSSNKSPLILPTSKGVSKGQSGENITGKTTESEIVALNKENSTMTDTKEDLSLLPEVTKSADPYFGYLTSLPTGDETKIFSCSGGMTPMTCLSDISALHSHNDGFEREDVTLNTDTDCTSPVDVKKEEVETAEEIAPHTFSSPDDDAKDSSAGEKDENNQAVGEDANDSSNSLNDLLQSSSDDNDLLEQYIQLAIPRKKSFTSSKSKTSKTGASSSRSKEKTQSRKVSFKSSSKKADQHASDSNVSDQRARNHTRKYDTSDRIAAANHRLNGVHIIQYIDRKMSTAPTVGDLSDSSEKEIGQELKPSVSSCQRSNISRQVIKTVETLDHSYSVKKQMREVDKSVIQLSSSGGSAANTSFVSTSLPAMCDQSKVQAFLQSRPATFNTEGTPVEISRSTSLSNLTFESGPETCDFSALQSRLTEKHALNQANATHDCANLQFKPILNQQSKLVIENTNKQSSPTSNLLSNDISNDSQAILESLSAQIKNMALDTEDRVRSRPDVGYVGSLPHVDEIKKFNMEGSISGHTNFSALTIDSETKISPCGHNLPNLPLLAIQPNNELLYNNDCKLKSPNSKKAEASSPQLTAATGTVVDRFSSSGEVHAQAPMLVQFQHYGEDTRNFVKEKPVSFRIEDTPLCLSGNNSSLSSIGIDSDGDEDDLLKACISSAIPGPRRDPTAALPPKQLLLSQNSNPVSYHGQGRGDSPIYPNVFVTTSGAQWPTNRHIPSTTAGGLVQQQQQLNTGNPPDQTSFALTCQPGTSYSRPTTQANDTFFELSRHPSLGESLNSDISGGSLVLGGDARSLMKTQKQSRAREKQLIERRSSGDKVMASKGRKKINRNAASMRARGNQCYHGHAKDNISTASSGTRHRDKQHRSSGGSKSPCNRCHPSHSRNQLPMSSSMGRLAETSPSRTKYRNPSSSHSKAFVAACGHAHEPRKPVRSRSAHSGYQSSVTQLYPPIRQINNVMLHGVASMAARGDMVLAKCDGHTTQYVPVTFITPYGTNSAHQPVFLKQGMVLQEDSGSVLSRSMSHNPTTSHNKQIVNPHASGHDSRHNSEKSKKGKLSWKGLKKFLSSTEDSKAKSSKKNRSVKSSPKPSHSRSIKKKIKEDAVRSDAEVWVPRKDGDGVKISKNPKENSLLSGRDRKEFRRRSPPLSTGRSLSLSLSSSSENDESNESVDIFQQNQQPGKSIYPTVSSVKNIPKSPSLKARLSVNRQPPTSSTSVGGYLARSKLKPGVEQIRKLSVESSSSATSMNISSRKIAQETPLASATTSKQASKAPKSTASFFGKKSKKSSSTSGQNHHTLSVCEITEISTEAQANEASQVSTSSVKRVVQEVAPFNYSPICKVNSSSDAEASGKRTAD